MKMNHCRSVETVTSKQKQSCLAMVVTGFDGSSDYWSRAYRHGRWQELYTGFHRERERPLADALYNSARIP